MRWESHPRDVGAKRTVSSALILMSTGPEPRGVAHEPTEGHLGAGAHAPWAGLFLEGQEQPGLGVGIEDAREEIAEGLVLSEGTHLHTLGRRRVDGLDEGHRNHLFPSEQEEARSQGQEPHKADDLPYD